MDVPPWGYTLFFYLGRILYKTRLKWQKKKNIAKNIPSLKFLKKLFDMKF